MTALPVTGRREARALAANAVLLSYFERFGKFPSEQDRLWQLDPFDELLHYTLKPQPRFTQLRPRGVLQPFVLIECSNCFGKLVLHRPRDHNTPKSLF